MQSQQDSTQTVQSQQSHDQLQGVQEGQNKSCEGLVFTSYSIGHMEQLDAQHAITSLAQVGCLQL